MEYDEFAIYFEKSPDPPGGFRMSIVRTDFIKGKDFQVDYSPDEEDPRKKICFKDGELVRPQDVKELGVKLRKLLFPTRAWGYFEESQQYAIRRGKGLRVRLYFDEETAPLSRLPWEYCFDDLDHRTFISLNKRTPIVRSISTGKQYSELETDKIRVLVAVASPVSDDLAQLYELKVHEKLKKAFDDLGQELAIETEFLLNATWDKLEDKLALGCDVFQFVGHGMISGRGAKRTAKIALEQENGDPDPRTHEEFRTLLQGTERLKLAFLTACNSATHDEGDMFSGLGQSLIQIEIPAVIGMQLRVELDIATKFTRKFFSRLSDGKPLEQALISARLGAYGDKSAMISWGIPVLYSQARDGVILRRKVVPTQAQASQEKVQQGQVVIKLEGARRRDERDVLEAVSTLNFKTQLTRFQTYRERNRAGAFVVSRRGQVGELGLNLLIDGLVKKLFNSTGRKETTPKVLGSEDTGTNPALLWQAVAKYTVPESHDPTTPNGIDPDGIAKAVANKLKTQNMVFIVKYHKNLQMASLHDFWSKIHDHVGRPVMADARKETMALLLIVDAQNQLPAESEHELFMTLPDVEPIGGKDFKSWYEHSIPLFPEAMQDEALAERILYGTKNGQGLKASYGVVDFILENLDILCKNKLLVKLSQMI